MKGQDPVTERVRVKRLPERGLYDRETIDAILDEGRICPPGFFATGHPFSIPTTPARPVEDRDEKLAGLRAIVEHVLPGRWSEARLPNDAELKQTLLLAIPLDEA